MRNLPSSWRRVVVEEGCLRLARIQNPGVKRMRDMSSMVNILLYRGDPSPHEPN